MRRKVACAVAVAVVLCGAPAWAQNDCQVVGFTTAIATGDAGILGLTGMCQAEFPGSRMCTTLEIAETRVLPTIGVANVAWVRPVYTANGNEAVLGIKSEELSCSGWSATSGKGVTVDAAGRFFQGAIPENCSNEHSVACCACSESVIGSGNGDSGLSCNTSTPIVYSAVGGKVTVTVEVRSACPSGVDINLVDIKKGTVTTQNVPNGSIQILTLTPKSEEIQVVPASPEAGSFLVDFTVN